MVLIKRFLIPLNEIDESFRKANEEIFRIKRGYGLWIWMPYFIYKTLLEICSDGDYLLYADGGFFLSEMLGI